jgi:cytochrome P450
MAQFHRGVVCVVGLERGHRLLREHKEQLGASVQPFNREIPDGFLRYMDDSTHRRYAGLFRASLSPAVVCASESTIRAAAAEELEDMAVASAQVQSISPEPYLERLVSRSFLSVLFGVQPGSESLERFEQIYPPLGEQSLGSSLGNEALEALEELRRWVMLEAESLRAHDERPVSSSALGGLARSAETMPDPTSVDNLLFIHKISSDNVVALLRWLVKTLGDRPDWVSRLQGEFDSATAADLSDRIVLETLRLAQSEYLYREIVEDFQFDGFTMQRKWLLRICVRESHGDPNVFHDADTFDPDRFLNHSFDSSQYSPFGFGPHACNGVHLTMMIARSWIESLCGGFDWSIVRDGPVEREFRHWSHWRPSRSLAISVAPRAKSDPSVVPEVSPAAAR